jgi:hypothetical protein
MGNGTNGYMTHDYLLIDEMKNRAMKYSGIDSLFRCVNKIHFIKFNKDISYLYNSRGFRDNEWDNYSNLSDKIWCVGDSFTVGIGQPVSERWSSILQTETSMDVINISMNGASNDWISRKARYIIDAIAPKYLVIQWSYISRREHFDSTLSDLNRRIQYVESNNSYDNCSNFIECMENIENNNNNGTSVIHTFIPNWSMDSDILKNSVFWESFISEMCNDTNIVMGVKQIDYSRDCAHYGVKTSTKYVENILELI